MHKKNLLKQPRDPLSYKICEPQLGLLSEDQA